MSKENRGHNTEEVEVGTQLLGNDKNCYCQLFIKLYFVFKLSRLNGYLKGYIKSRINKLAKEKTIIHK